ncbi:MAG: hypothetical protein AAF485_31055, partial [Chloroflexota bacterium]
RYNVDWLDAKWTRSTYNEWSDALQHPLASDAAVIAHWGDLTSFWYMQYAENRRPDLHGLYPPSQKVIDDWYAKGGDDVYIAGPLYQIAEGLEEEYQLVPWGRLVRVIPLSIRPRFAIPDLPQTIDKTFDNKLLIIKADYAPQAIPGDDYNVVLTWRNVSETLSAKVNLSLRFIQDGVIVAQLDDTLISGWFPRDPLPSGQFGLSHTSIPIPRGTLPGDYRLQLVAYTDYKSPWALSDGTTILDLGEVEITHPPPGHQPNSAKLIRYIQPANHDFNGEISLAGYQYSVRRAGQGKGFALRLLWQTKQQPVDNYLLIVEIIDHNGTVLRTFEHQPQEGRIPTSSWQSGQLIRDQVDLILPASSPIGAEAVSVRLSWRRPNETLLNLRRLGIPLGNTLTLNTLAVTEKKDRIFEPPIIEEIIGANLENKASLLGYNSTNLEDDGGALFLTEPACQDTDAGCHLQFDFYWQGLNEMEKPYSIFMHLVDDQGAIIAQQDRAPGRREKEPTTGWLPQEIIHDPTEFRLPADLSPGQYTLRLGLYLPPQGPRLLLFNQDNQPIADFIELGPLVIEP